MFHIHTRYLARSLGEDILQFHDFLHKSMEVIAGRTCWDADNNSQHMSKYPKQENYETIMLQLLPI